VQKKEPKLPTGRQGKAHCILNFSLLAQRKVTKERAPRAPTESCPFAQAAAYRARQLSVHTARGKSQRTELLFWKDKATESLRKRGDSVEYREIIINNPESNEMHFHSCDNFLIAF